MLLDTCALIWLVHDQERLSESVRREIDETAVVYISAITAFEIGIKSRKGKLVLPVPPGKWFSGVVDHHSLTVIDIDPDICILSTELLPIHNDPCDRFIIATALKYNFAVVTADRRFSEYGIGTMI